MNTAGGQGLDPGSNGAASGSKGAGVRVSVAVDATPASAPRSSSPPIIHPVSSLPVTVLPIAVAGLQIVRVMPDQRQMAAERIVGSGTDGHGSQAAAARRFLESAASLNIDVSLMWGTIDPSGRHFHHVCLAVVGAGRTAMLFFSNPDPDPPTYSITNHDRSGTNPLVDPAFFRLDVNSSPGAGVAGRTQAGSHTHPDVPTHILQQEALVRHACHHLRELKTPPVSRGVSRRDADTAGGSRRDACSMGESRQDACTTGEGRQDACTTTAGPDTRIVALVQGLLEVHETDAMAALGRAGFMRLGDLAYMRRSLPRHSGSERSRLARMPRGGRSAPLAEGFTWPMGVVLRRLSDINASEHDALLAIALERSYIDTQDCPELCGLRDVADVLDSHRSVGDYDPALWWIIEYQGKPEGAMLLSACPEQQTIELVYLGISPVLRGKGIGSAMLALGLKELTGRPEGTISCAVDTRNAPAMKLYKRAGFQQFSTRVPMVMGI